MNDKRSRVLSRRCLRLAGAFLIVGSFAGCAGERPWAIKDLASFERAFDDSLVVATTELPTAVVGKEYNFVLEARGKPKPFRWKLVSGQLPGGMEMDDSGEIRGTATAPEVARFVVKVACGTFPSSSVFGESPHIGWRMRRLTLVVKNADLSSPDRATKALSKVTP